jgi:hypothetical protein
VDDDVEGRRRAALFGEDESSDVKCHEPSIDMLAGAPAWLPYERLRDHLEGYELGCVYWFEQGTWHRAPYPDDLDDDGLDCGMSRLVTREDAADEMINWLGRGKNVEACDRFVACAERRAVTMDILRSFAGETGRVDADLPGMYAIARRAGLTEVP